MKRWGLIIVLLALPLTALANCDLTRFHWECDMAFHPKPTRYAQSLVYCGNTYGYVTREQFDILTNYNRADVNMILTVNGEYVDSPCIPARRSPNLPQ
jgi:hypothetical protein